MARKSLYTVITLLFLFVVSINLQAQGQPSVSVSASKKSFSPGENGVLLIKFKTGPKVKIPKEPGVEVISISGVNGGNLQGVGGAGEYIESKLVKYNFTVPSDAAPGSTIKVTGSVKFGYCNSDDGVCKLGKSNFTANIKVK